MHGAFLPSSPTANVGGTIAPIVGLDGDFRFILLVRVWPCELSLQEVEWEVCLRSHLKRNAVSAQRTGDALPTEGLTKCIS